MTSLRMKDACDKRLTIAIVGTSISSTFSIPSHGQIAHDSVLGTIGFGYLIVTAAFHLLLILHFPLLKASHCNVLAEEHVECSIYVLEQIIANEDKRIKSFKDHANFHSWVPAIMAPRGGERGFKSMPSAFTHGLKKSRASATIWDLSSTSPIAWNWCNVEISWWKAAVLMSFKVTKIALRYYQQEFRERKCSYLLLNWIMWDAYPVSALRWLCECANTPQQHNQSSETANDDSPGNPTKGSITSSSISWSRDVLRSFGCLREWYWVRHSPTKLWLWLVNLDIHLWCIEKIYLP